MNRGGATGDELEYVGQYTGAIPGGADLKLIGSFQVVYNSVNETIGTLGWGVVGKVASIIGFEWNKDIPMNIGENGSWYSVPVRLNKDDEIKVRWQGAWEQDFGGGEDPVAADTAIPAVASGKNLKAAEDGLYMVVFDPTGNTLTLSTDFWGLVGEFNSWGEQPDRFLMPNGTGKWYAWNQEISGGWKIRKRADWTVSAGGTYAAAGEAFDAVTDNGPNIAVTDMTRFDVLFDAAGSKITISKPVK